MDSVSTLLDILRKEYAVLANDHKSVSPVSNSRSIVAETRLIAVLFADFQYSSQAVVPEYTALYQASASLYQI